MKPSLSWYIEKKAEMNFVKNKVLEADEFSDEQKEGYLRAHYETMNEEAIRALKGDRYGN